MLCRDLVGALTAIVLGYALAVLHAVTSAKLHANLSGAFLFQAAQGLGQDSGRCFENA